MKRLQDQPFALLGINSDGEAEELKKILAENDITWRQAVDGDTSGPWATKWNVSGWPTIFVIDSQGVIRHKDLRDQELEDAVLELVAEVPKAQ